MKIYQIHDLSGEWEDFCDMIVGSYLHKDRALLALEHFIEREKELTKCNKCPLYYCPSDCDGKDCDTKQCDNNLIKLTKEYCKNYKPNKRGCENYYTKYDESTFKLEEVEVIE